MLNFVNPKFQEDVMERLGARAHYPKLGSCVYSTQLPLVNAPMTRPRIGGATLSAQVQWLPESVDILHLL